MYSEFGSVLDTDLLHPPAETSLENLLSSFTREETSWWGENKFQDNRFLPTGN